MSNTKNKVVILNADRPRILKASHKALKKMTAMLKKPIEELDIGSSDWDKLETVVYCLCLKDARKHGETLELSQMEDILDEAETEQEIIDAITDAIESAFPSKQPLPNSPAATQTPPQIVAPDQDGIGMQA